MKKALYFLLVPVAVVFLLEIVFVLRRQPETPRLSIVSANLESAPRPITPTPVKDQISRIAVVEPKKAPVQSSDSSAASPAKSASPSSSSPNGTVGRPAFLGGENVHAVVTIKGKTFNLISNQLGNYGRVYLKGKDRATVDLSYPVSASGQPVLVQVKDGGEILNSKGVGALGEMLKLGKNGEATVSFQAGTENGIYRLMIQHGSDMKQIDFWVGEPHKTKALAENK